MSRVFDIASIVAEYVFDDTNPDYYDPVEKRFKDQCGFGRNADIRITTGTPLFTTVNGKRVLDLDNTFHGLFHSPIPWMGTIIATLQPNWVSGATVSKYPLIFGDLSIASNGRLRVTHSSGTRSVNFETTSGSISVSRSRADNNMVCVAFSVDQETRTGYATADGTTVVTAAGPVSTTNGVGVTPNTGQYGVRFGNLSTTAGDVTQATDMTVRLARIAFAADNELLVAGNLATVKAYMDQCKSEYAAS